MGEFLYNTEVGSLRPKIYSNKNIHRIMLKHTCNFAWKNL